MSGIQVSAIRVQVGVNMGDHAETVRKAVEVSRDETVGEVADRLLSKLDWSAFPGDGVPVADSSVTLELRAIEPKEGVR